jgi:cytochrome c oxidase assembly protein Cox11
MIFFLYKCYNILVLVGIAGYAVVPLYKYMWTYLADDRIHT